MWIHLPEDEPMRCLRCESEAKDWEKQQGLMRPVTIDKRIFYLCAPCAGLILKEWVIGYQAVKDLTFS